MLEHLTRFLGKALSSVRAGAETLAIAELASAETQPIHLTSTAFADGARLPERHTADGEGISPPLAWTAAPPGTAALALLVEDADAPAPRPLVHALVWDIDPDTNMLEEGAIGEEAAADDSAAPVETGRNSFQQRSWLPPDPPPGHGDHRYVFQIFALSRAADLGSSPGRSKLVEALRDTIVGAGALTGTYSRDEPADAGPATAAAAAATPQV